MRTTTNDVESIIIDNGFVDEGLLLKSNFVPIDGEEEIYHFRRLDWFSHGPLQLLILTIGVVATILANQYLDVRAVLACAFLTVITYWWVWMKWAYKYLVMTNARMQLIFDPPFSMPGSVDSSPIDRLVGMRSVDPSWFTNLFNYGSLFSETAATDIDKWIKDGVKFVRDHRQVRDMIEMLQIRTSKSSRE
jgi:hypothetical protein